MDIAHPPSFARVTVHRAAPIRRALLLVVIAALYVAAGKFVWDTVGEPYRLAVDAAEAAEEERFAALEAQERGNSSGVGSTTVADVSGRVSDGEREEEEEAELDVAGEVLGTDRSSSGGAVKLAIPKKTASLAESIELLAREEEGSGSGEKRFPSPYQPDTWALAALFLVVTCHVLFHLLCRWSTWFKAMSLYQPWQSVGTRCGARLHVYFAFRLPAPCRSPTVAPPHLPRRTWCCDPCTTGISPWQGTAVPRAHVRRHGPPGV